MTDTSAALSDLNEEWRVIPDTDSMYEVSNFGRFRSWRNARWGRREVPRIVRTIPTSTGHHLASISMGNRGVRKELIHRLVASAFIAEPGDLMVLHRDDNPDNNHVGNLYIGTRSDNEKDKWRNGRMANRKNGWVTRRANMEAK